MPRHKTKCEIECYKCNSSDNVYYFRKRDLRNVYKCYTCDFEFHDKKDLRRSVERTKYEGVCCYKCNSADNVYHLGKSKGRTTYKCDSCNVSFIDTNDLNGIRPGLKLDYVLDKDQYNIFTGHMLGDGGLNKNGVFKICRSAKDSGYLSYTTKMFTDIINNENILTHKESKINGSKNDIECWSKIMATLSTNQFKQEYNRWYPDNKKIIPSDIKISPQALAIWYLDDGSVSAGKNKANSICLYTDNFTKDEVVFLSHILLQNFDLKFSFHKHDRKRATNVGYYLNICGKENILKFANVINPYIFTEMNMGDSRGISGEIFDKASPNKTPWKDKNTLDYLRKKYCSTRVML